MDETLLMYRLRQGDSKAFDMLFDLLYPQLQFFTEQVTKDVQKAEDLSNPFSFPQSNTIKTYYTSLSLIQRPLCFWLSRTRKTESEN